MDRLNIVNSHILLVMEDENVNPMMGANMRIAEILGQKYGSDSPEILYVLLSNSAFKHAIDQLRHIYGIKLLNKKTSDVSAQQYIADCVAAKSGKTIRNQDDFENYYGEFKDAVRALGEKHHIPNLPVDLMDQYLVKGDTFLAQQHAHNLIKIAVNKQTKALTIKLNPLTKKRDLLDVLTVIYESWDSQRGSVTKKQPATAVDVHSQIVRYAEDNTEKETAEKFGQTEENVHKIKMRMKKRRKEISENNGKP